VRIPSRVEREREWRYRYISLKPHLFQKKKKLAHASLAAVAMTFEFWVFHGMEGGGGQDSR